MFGKCFDNSAAGVVDQNIEPTELIDGKLNGVFGNILFRQITDQAHNLNAAGLQFLRRVLELRAIDIR